ncbi:hypothetical protein [Herbiconiux sp. A18JL235]|uniref:Uncharacterized protein n=1 Tax=Herbiconiux sp. A18JL235 TaxID=3152363 RepID=A0AB39BL96_9MICO
MGWMRGAGVVMTLAVVVGLSGCTFLRGGDSCLPGLEVAPSPAVAGASITISAPDPCGVEVPDGGWEVVVTLGDGGDPVLTRTTTQPFDGSFELTIDLPADLPPGQAYVDVANWTYVPCDDTGTGSCATAARPFEIVAPE